MSLPAKTFLCTKCNFHQGDIRTWGARAYVLPRGEEIQIPRRLGWCNDCGGLASVEMFSLEIMRKAIDDAQSELGSFSSQPASQECQVQQKGLGSNWIYNTETMESKRKRLTSELKEAKLLLAMMERRQSLPRCLECGGTSVVAPLVSDWSGLRDLRSPKPTGFIHPGCGGEFMVVEEGIRFALRPSIRRYTPEGEFIEQVFQDER